MESWMQNLSDSFYSSDYYYNPNVQFSVIPESNAEPKEPLPSTSAQAAAATEQKTEEKSAEEPKPIKPKRRGKGRHSKILLDGPPYKCDVCDKVIDEFQRFLHHRRYHNRKPSFFCPVEGCGENFIMKSYLERHLDFYHSSNQPLCFACPAGVTGCNRKYVSKNWLSRHISEHARRRHISTALEETLNRSILEDPDWGTMAATVNPTPPPIQLQAYAGSSGQQQSQVIHQSNTVMQNTFEQPQQVSMSIPEGMGNAPYFQNMQASWNYSNGGEQATPPLYQAPPEPPMIPSYFNYWVAPNGGTEQNYGSGTY